MNKRVGLIAGSGMLPIIFAHKAEEKGYRVVACAYQNEADHALEKEAFRVYWLPVGRLNKLIGIFKKEGISEIAMVGRIAHPKLFDGLKIDLRAIKLLSKLKDKKADTILGAVADELAKDGMKLIPSSTFMEELLAKKGVVSKLKPSKREKEDIEFGYKIAKAIAGLDIGQTVVVKERAVLAVEALEGTDECIRRGGKIAKGGAVVVKVFKPQQDLRFDLPVIGSRTIEVMNGAGASCLALDEGKAFILEKERVKQLADKYKIKVIVL